jgi:hypothetical protein
MTNPDHGDALDGPAQIGGGEKERPKLYVIEVSPDGKDWEQLSLPFPIDDQSLTLTIRGKNMLKIRDGWRMLHVVDVYD